MERRISPGQADLAGPIRSTCSDVPHPPAQSLVARAVRDSYGSALQVDLPQAYFWRRHCAVSAGVTQPNSVGKTRIRTSDHEQSPRKALTYAQQTQGKPPSRSQSPGRS